jgi:hypothetical protein
VIDSVLSAGLVDVLDGGGDRLVINRAGPEGAFWGAGFGTVGCNATHIPLEATSVPLRIEW